LFHFILKEVTMQKMSLRQLCVGIALASLCLLVFGASAFAQSDTAADKTVAIDTIITDTSKNEPGVLIIAVESGSPAATAGLARGDILLKVNGKPVNNVQELLAVMQATKPGDSATVTIQHGDATRELTVTLGERKGRPFLGIVPLMADLAKSSIALAMPGKPLLPEAPDAMLAVTPTLQVRVIEVIKASPADKAGLQVGDAIIALNGTPLSPKASLAGQIQALTPSDVITLEIQPGDQGPTIERKVTLGKQPDDPERAFLGVKVAPVKIILLRKQLMDSAQGDYFNEAMPVPYLGWWMPPPLYGMPPMLMPPYGYWFGQPGFEINGRGRGEDFLMPMPPGVPTGDQPFFYSMPRQLFQPPLSEPVQIELPDDPAI
jgi:membrane-associated protease RseP (regulator of RpoE activity)